MDFEQLDQSAHDALERVLGYLNFSEGNRDPQVFRALDQLYRLWPDDGQPRDVGLLGGAVGPDGCTWSGVVDWLSVKLRQLEQSSDTFRACGQAAAVLAATRQLVPEYLSFHRDLLFHQTAQDLFNSSMLGKVFESLLSQSPPWPDPSEAIVSAIGKLNDFLGYRPVPALQWHRVEVHPHEMVSPVPLYLAGVGASSGKYQEFVERGLEILEATDEDILASVGLDPRRMKELAFDPRAYDFDHPVNKRPNYHFGEWDPHSIDNRGFYQRFVIREVTLQAMAARVKDGARLRIPREELVWEAAAVLVGTMLMSSAISGSGPDAHDSTVTLGKLVPRVAASRDAFYSQLFDRVEGPHGERLRREARLLRQPFGGARQHLNLYLARQRGSQLEHVRLAKVFARMGYLSAAQRQSDAVPVASARILCRIDCGLTASYHALRRQDRPLVLQNVDRIIDWIHRGIACGAMVDPWNIIGFDAHFSLFPALENSVHDHRVDDLLRIMDRLFDVLARLWSDSAATDDSGTMANVAARYEELANWWNAFATHEVSSVEADPPLDGLRAARDVAQALGQWQQSGGARGDVGFWAPHVQAFESPKPYSLVLETLLARHDFASSMSLLVHWISQAARVPLERRGASFHELMFRWVREVGNQSLANAATTIASQVPGSAAPASAPWGLLCKFFDYLEANAEDLWNVSSQDWRLPDANGTKPGPAQKSTGPADDEEDSGKSLFDAAYEDVVYRDSTDDGFDGEVYDSESRSPGDDAWDHEVERYQMRLLFLFTLARCWIEAGIAIGRAAANHDLAEVRPRLRQATEAWRSQAASNQAALLALLDQVESARLSKQGTDVEAMARYDRQRMLKESLLEQIILTCVKTAAANLTLDAACSVLADPPTDVPRRKLPSRRKGDIAEELAFASDILAAALRRDRDEATHLAGELIDFLAPQQILYAPIARGGSPRKVATTRIRQQYIQDTLVALPRLGLIRRNLELIDTIRRMEHNVPSGQGAVTQFDDMFEVGFREMVEALVRSTDNRSQLFSADDQDADTILISCLEQLTESALASWLQHSQTLRLSVLERVRNPQQWKALVEFIEKYGGDIFSQDFLFLGNVRAILHFGPESWLRECRDQLEPPDRFRLLDALDRDISLDDAAQKLGLILEAIAENYDEYRDYNSTTTQSDFGEKLYVLLDFLRLRAEYDRVAWNLRPVILSHRVLVRSGRTEAAQLWRRTLHDRLGAEAERYQRKLTRLQKKYAVIMGTVAQRISERFLQPMTIDRMQALIEPATEQLQQGVPSHAFEILEDEAELLMREPLGGGVAIPKWLSALEDEVDQHESNGEAHEEFRSEDVLPLDTCPLTIEELQEQLADEAE